MVVLLVAAVVVVRRTSASTRCIGNSKHLPWYVAVTVCLFVGVCACVAVGACMCGCGCVHCHRITNALDCLPVLHAYTQRLLTSLQHIMAVGVTENSGDADGGDGIAAMVASATAAASLSPATIAAQKLVLHKFVSVVVELGDVLSVRAVASCSPPPVYVSPHLPPPR